MKTKSELRQQLFSIDNKSYKSYKQIRGIYDFGNFSLNIDYVQGDPFASPSQLAVTMTLKESGIPLDPLSNRSRMIALCDFLSRQFSVNCRRLSSRRGIGHSGKIFMPFMGQEILERNACILADESIEVRFNAGLPARGRSVLGKQAVAMLLDDLEQIVEASLYYQNLDQSKLDRHVEVAEDADILRSQLADKDLVAFVANGSVLPRKSGVDDRPMQEGVIPFQSPESLVVEMELPNRGSVKGMGIPKGITLIVGGGYHGKSTLLRAISMGIYNHLPDDGRELVVTLPSAMKIRSEDERSVTRVNIAPFINNLPMNQSTEAFSTPNASGSTSQAANIMEALEAGAKLLLVDEDTSATNFMIRDHRMQQLIAKEEEPITPFLDKVRQMYDDHSVSTLLVMGGSGDYFEVADTVIAMKEFKPHDVTEEAMKIARQYQTLRQREGGAHFGDISNRRIDYTSLKPEKGKKSVSVKVYATENILFGGEKIDLSQVEQLADEGQLKAIGEALVHLHKQHQGNSSLSDNLDKVEQLLEKDGLDALSPQLRGDLCRFRKLELAASINRYRKLKISAP